MQIISNVVADPDPALPPVALAVSRQVLAKRIWRGIAADGVEFGFELASPLRHGDCFWQTVEARYLVEQEPEDLLEIALDLAPSAAAGIGWAVGNLHLELQAEAHRLLTPNAPAARQLLDRLKIAAVPTRAVFRPGRFVRGQLVTHELGTSHRH